MVIFHILVDDDSSWSEVLWGGLMTVWLVAVVAFEV